MKKGKKILKAVTIKKRKSEEKEMEAYIDKLQQESKISLEMSLKEFILSRR